MPIHLTDHGKAARVVPHRPPDAVLLQRSAYVAYPNGAISSRRKVAKGPEFVTGKRDLILCSPGGSHRDLLVNAFGVPTVFAVAKQILTRRVILNGIEHFTNALRTRRVRNILEKGQIGAGPRRTLMRKGKGLVEVEVVNDIPVSIRLHKQQLRNTGPPMA